MKVITGYAILRIAVFFLLLFIAGLLVMPFLTKMPGERYTGPLPPLTPEQAETSKSLQHIVEYLAEKIGRRNFIYIDNLNTAADFIERSLLHAGLPVQRQTFSVMDNTFYNIEAEKKGNEQDDKIIIIGAHYDSVIGSPGANDNASGVAALLELARLVTSQSVAKTIRFVAFANEEPPFFWTENMGSYVYAKRCKERGENIVAMIALETMGYYADYKRSQHYIFPLGLFHPSEGNFIAFVSNLSSRSLLKKAIASFRNHAQFPSEGGSFPWFTPGIFWSDHWPFWDMGCRALMVTDTALFRYPYYHLKEDTPDKIDYERLARVVIGLEKVIVDLAKVDEQ